jgi:hypothetical protein
MSADKKQQENNYENQKHGIMIDRENTTLKSVTG